MQSALESFRDQWLRELGDEPERETGMGEAEERDPMAVAVDLFLKAGRNEEKGKLVKAVRLYRRAFKLCPELEEVQTQRELRLEERAEKESRGREEERTHVTESRHSIITPSLSSEREEESDNLALPNWALEFSSSPCLPLIPVAEGKAHISVLPNEVLAAVFFYCAAQPETLEVVGRVCRRWFSASRENALWRVACARRWPGEEELLARHVAQDLAANWRRCYVERPRPRCDGLYVSTNKYVRHGEQEGFYCDPVHEVHYWRLLRFFPSGEVLSLCTVEKSSAKRMHIQIAMQQRETSRRGRGNRRDPHFQAHPNTALLEKTDLGSFRMVGDAFAVKLQALVQAASGKHTNTLTGVVYSSRAGWQDRIKLESYMRRKTETGSESHFDPKFIAVYKFVKLPPQFLNYQQPE